MRSFQRNRPTYAVLVTMVVGVGLASRSQLADHLSDFVATYAGDALWALMVFLSLGFVFPQMRTLSVAVLAIGFSVTVEVSQLYQADWINRIRETRPGALVLGSGFLWSDLVCYSAGVVMGGIGEVLFALFRARK